MKILTSIFILTTLQLAADEFDRWTWRNPKPLGSTLYSIIYAGDQFVAVGAQGEIVTSPDGREWTMETSGTNGRFLGIAHGDNRFVAYGFTQNPGGSPSFKAHLAVSPDARNWTLPEHNLMHEIRGLAHGSTTWVALDSYGNLHSSANLGDWTLRMSSVTTAFSDVIFAQEKFVAVGSRGVIVTSTNGVDWVQQDSGTVAGLSDIAYGGEKFVVVGGSDAVIGEGVILVSADAEDWLIQFTDFPLRGIAFGPNGFTAVGGTGFGFGCGQSLNSGNGLYFEPGPPGCDSGISADPYDVACNEEVCVGVGYGGGIWVTEDGLNWTGIQEGLVQASLFASAASETRLVVVGGPNAILATADGRNIVVHPLPGIWRGVATDGAAFVAVGEGGVLAESADGSDWQFIASPTTSDLYGLAHGPAGWLAAGGGGALVRKSPGGSWETLPAFGTATLRRLRYSPRLNVYVAVGDQGTLAFSADGMEWSSRGPGTSEGLYDYADNPQYSVVISTKGSFISTDTLTWTEVPTGTKQQSSLIYCNGLFVLGAGNPKALLTTEDGLNWRNQFVSAQYLTGLAYFKSSIYAVGANGMILQSISAAVPEFLSISPGGSTLDFELFGEIGRDYELQSSTNLSDWDHEQDYTQSARQHPLTLPTGPDQRFYRVKLKE